MNTLVAEVEKMSKMTLLKPSGHVTWTSLVNVEKIPKEKHLDILSTVITNI